MYPGIASRVAFQISALDFSPLIMSPNLLTPCSIPSIPSIPVAAPTSLIHHPVPKHPPKTHQAQF